MATNLEKLRLKEKLLPQQMAKRLGISTRQYNDIEYSPNLLNYELINKIVEEFNVSADYILGISTIPLKADDLYICFEKNMKQYIEDFEKACSFKNEDGTDNELIILERKQSEFWKNRLRTRVYELGYTTETISKLTGLSTEKVDTLLNTPQMEFEVKTKDLLMLFRGLKLNFKILEDTSTTSGDETFDEYRFQLLATRARKLTRINKEKYLQFIHQLFLSNIKIKSPIEIPSIYRTSPERIKYLRTAHGYGGKASRPREALASHLKKKGCKCCESTIKNIEKISAEPEHFSNTGVNTQLFAALSKLWDLPPNYILGYSKENDTRKSDFSRLYSKYSKLTEESIYELNKFMKFITEEIQV